MAWRTHISTIAVFAGALSISVVLAEKSAAEYRLDDLTAKQRARLEERMHFYSTFTAVLAFCGRTPRLERDIQKAVHNCVDAQSLETVRRRFRSLHDAELESFRGVSPDRFCRIDRAVEIMKKAEKEFDSLISEAYRLCRLCVTC